MTFFSLNRFAIMLHFIVNGYAVSELLVIIFHFELDGKKITESVLVSGTSFNREIAKFLSLA